MLVDILSHPSSQGQTFPRSRFVDELLHTTDELFDLDADTDATFKPSINFVHNPSVVTLSEKYFQNGELLDDWVAFSVDVGPEIELLV